MGWFRRARPTPPDPAVDDGPRGDEHALVAVPPTSPDLVRTERALQLLATQSAQLHASIVHLEQRVDAMTDTLADQVDRPSHDDVAEARRHTTRVAAELSRLEINVAARIDAVRSDVVGVPSEIDLRRATPVDTGW